MDIAGAALPNLMFIVGILALGLGLGIELKVVSLNKEINKAGRIGALTVGVLLVLASVMMYLNPSIGRGMATGTSPAPAAALQSGPAQAVLPATSILAPAQQPATPAPTSAPPPAQEPAVVAPAADAGVAVPDLHGLSEKDARRTLEQLGLRLGQQKDRCEGPDQGSEVKKGRLLCQNPPAGTLVATGTAVDYVLLK